MWAQELLSLQPTAPSCPGPRLLRPGALTAGGLHAWGWRFSSAQVPFPVAGQDVVLEGWVWPPAHPGPGLSEPQGDLPCLPVLSGTDPLVGGGHQVPGLAMVLISWPCVSVPGREAFMLPTISNG